MNSKLMKIRDALTSIEGLKVYHYWRTRQQAPYCIWQEDGEGNSLHTNNHKTEQVISGTVDYFTLNEYDENIEAIQNALNSLENCGWSLTTVLYEEETNLIHYEWSWEII